MISKIYKYFLQSSKIRHTFLFLSFIIVAQLLIATIIIFFSYTSAVTETSHSTLKIEFSSQDWFWRLIVAPIFETIVFQWCIISFVKRYFPTRNLLAILLSSCFFGIMHLQSLVYIIRAFIIGVLLGFNFEIGRKKSLSFAIKSTIFIHFFWNLLSLCLRFFIYKYQ